MVGEDAVVMPPRYFADSVIEKNKDGRTSFDTVWHKIPEFAFTDQLGRRITPAVADGKIWVVNTFFTRCPNICPALTRNVRKLQASFENPKRKKFGDTTLVYFMSFSVDPARDSIEALKRWATRFFVNSDNWSLLTGPKKDIYGLLFDDFKLSARDGEGIDTNFIHTEKVMLVDRDRVVRGFYNGLDSIEMGQLAEDIGKLYLGKGSPETIFVSRIHSINPGIDCSTYHHFPRYVVPEPEERVLESGKSNEKKTHVTGSHSKK
jgi:protein SCO1/2